MTNDYYILVDGEQSGPFSYDELTEMDLDIHTRVLSPLGDTWQDACDLPEFYPYFESRGIYLPTGDNLASFGWRFLAWIFDYLVVSYLTSFVVKVLVLKNVIPVVQSYEALLKAPRVLLILQLSFSLTLILYNSICEASPLKGSIGKKLCRLVVVDINGMGLSYLNSLLRSAGKAISIFFLYTGFLSIFFTEHRQALHDMLAKTYVVKL
ncbi:RDD family protein [Mucilaginibacter sp.]|uniref:RDD family protein n=1 Tax=Mucilaginibacter sp. TaxID=1882438 RepID=UPI002612EC76|nr:RDD family protein [Mucilaginibacter sp.]MDB4921876.1 putative rane protein YckC, family [Mucilaginibacter sp.]